MQNDIIKCVFRDADCPVSCKMWEHSLTAQGTRALQASHEILDASGALEKLTGGETLMLLANHKK